MRALRVTLVVTVLLAGAAGLLRKRYVDGWSPREDELADRHCRRDAQWCPTAARLLWSRGERKAATTAARLGCERDDAESCRWLGHAFCTDVKTYEDAARTLSKACALGDDTACFALRDFVMDERFRGLVPKTERPRQAWIGAAMNLARENRAQQAREVMAAVDAPRSSELLEAGLAINAGQPFHLSSVAGPEGAILSAAGKAAAEGDNVTRAMLKAWRAAGQPDLRASELLGVHGPITDDPACEVIRPGSPDLAPGAPIADRLHAFHWLDRDFSPGPAALRQRLLESLRAQASADAYLTAWLIAEGGTGALDGAELEALERASRGPWAPPRSEALARYRRDGPGSPPAMDLFPDAFLTVSGRLTLTAAGLPADRRKALGEALVILGEKMAHGRWFLEVLYGKEWMRLGAELAGDEEASKREHALSRRLAEFGPDDAFAKLGRWPLAAWDRESLQRLEGDQVSELRALMELPP